MISDTFYSVYVVLRETPDIVVGFGGYTSGAIILIASLLGIKTLIHEQNVVPGRANCMLDRFAKSVAVSFDETKRYIENRNVIVTGNPIRNFVKNSDRHAALSRLGLKTDRFTILIVGGSQGAHALNLLTQEAISTMDRAVVAHIQVIHLTGDKDYSYISSAYDKNGIMAKTYAFLEDINDAYAACDLAISRSGAAALFELSLHGKPMLLVPYPSKKNSQRHNARYFAEREAAIYKEENELEREGLKRMLEMLIKDSKRLSDLSRNAQGLAVPDAARRLATEIIRVAG
jgi:UDP-N-acetylglucosamine--N-acetylmuramyl-(pentapeptide) pyrophosphoryl-undecaprenol N-acetylglucosamine transferase